MSIHSPSFNCESTGFQPTVHHVTRMNYSDKLKTHRSAWPRKLSTVMESHRQRFSQLNQKYKQRPVVLFPQSSDQCPVILPQPYSRAQPRQQTRLKPQIQTPFPPPTSSTRQSEAIQTKYQLPGQQYITLANLTKILHVLQTEEKTNDSETGTEGSTSTINSAKQRVQQHLQETATRWWKPMRSSDSNCLSSTINISSTSPLHHQQYLDDNNQLPKTLPLITIVSNSTRQMLVPVTKYDESESSTEVQPTTVLTSFITPTKISSTLCITRQEPLIMQARGMRVHSYDQRSYNNHNNMNFFQQQRLIRQT